MSENIMPAPTPEEEITELRERIEQLQQELADANTAAGDVAQLRRDLDTARNELTELRRTPPPPTRRVRREGLFEEETTE